MTSTIWPLLENCCGCQDDGCNNKWAINIVSTNPDCLRVDTSECWVVKLEPTCPKPTYVKAWDGVTIKQVVPPSDCYASWADCWIDGWREISSTDEMVKACENDTTPGTLLDKLEAWKWIDITKNWCDEHTNSKLVISVDEDDINVKFPPIKIVWESKLITLAVEWWDKHTIRLTDKEDSTYNNMCCIWFKTDQDFEVEIDKQWNSDTPLFMWEDWHNWTIFTGNEEMATKKWIKILADGYYRLFWQITVQNNITKNKDEFYFNLWRWLLRIHWDRAALNDNMYLSTAKHWAYGRQVLLTAGSWIAISDSWEIKTWSWDWQTSEWFDWPWMTFNIDCLVDLKKDDIITVWYRPQSDSKSNPDYDAHNPHPQIWGSFRFVWQNDSSTDYNALFWGTVLWVYQLAPKRFQKWKNNEVYQDITN